jgi:hypothetical protein
MELMPLSANDVYSFDYNRVTGVILEFSCNKGSLVSYTTLIGHSMMWPLTNTEYAEYVFFLFNQ